MNCNPQFELEMIGCRVMCEEVKKEMTRIGLERNFDGFIECTNALDYSSRRQCGQQFRRCTAIVPGHVWNKALTKARHKGRQAR